MDYSTPPYTNSTTGHFSSHLSQMRFLRPRMSHCFSRLSSLALTSTNSSHFTFNNSRVLTRTSPHSLASASPEKLTRHAFTSPLRPNSTPRCFCHSAHRYRSRRLHAPTS